MRRAAGARSLDEDLADPFDDSRELLLVFDERLAFALFLQRSAAARKHQAHDVGRTRQQIERPDQTFALPCAETAATRFATSAASPR
jgi:hypothetical protein